MFKASRATLENPLKLACACSGNTCRSPVCFHYLSKVLKEQVESGLVKIMSGGTCTTLNRPLNEVTPESAYIVISENMDSQVASSNSKVYLELEGNDVTREEDKKKIRNRGTVDNKVKTFNPAQKDREGIAYHRSQPTNLAWLNEMKDGIILAMDQSTLERLQGKKNCQKQGQQCQTQFMCYKGCGGEKEPFKPNSCNTAFPSVYY
jgi:hypothetical protein